MPIARLLLWVSTLGALALLVRNLWFEPVAGVWGLVALGWLLFLVIAGVLNPRWEMFADVLWCAPEGEHGIAFTFDDGPDPVNTPKVLKILEQHGARATFFLIGKKAEAHPEVVRAIVDAGHCLGVHSYAHEYRYGFLPVKRIAGDIQRCQKLLQDITGKKTRLFRPPVGQVSPRTATGAKRADVVIVGWSVRGRDGLKSTTAKQVIERIKPRLGDGAIVLLHDAAETGDREPVSLGALPELLAAAAESELQCVGLDEWLVEQRA